MYKNLSRVCDSSVLTVSIVIICLMHFNVRKYSFPSALYWTKTLSNLLDIHDRIRPRLFIALASSSLTTLSACSTIEWKFEKIEGCEQSCFFSNFRKVKLLESNLGDRKARLRLWKARCFHCYFVWQVQFRSSARADLAKSTRSKELLLLVSIDNNYSSFLIYMVGRFFYLLQSR